MKRIFSYFKRCYKRKLFLKIYFTYLNRLERPEYSLDHAKEDFLDILKAFESSKKQ